MKKTLLALFLFLLTTNSKAQYLDEVSVKLHQPKELKKDVDMVQTLLEKDHP